MPKRTIQLLDHLEALGFNDEHLSRVHHFERGVSVRRMRVYCEKTESFQAGGTNERVRKRLEIVLKSLLAGGYSTPAGCDTLRGLCTAALSEVPK